MREIVSTTSSIGASWPPSVSPNNRLRGFFPEFAETPVQISEFIDHFSAAKENLSEGEGADRLSIRLITGRDGIDNINASDVKIEGILPVANLAIDKKLFIVYAGWNKDSRSIQSHHVSQHIDSIAQAKLKSLTTDNDPTLELKNRGFDTNILSATGENAHSPLLVAKFHECYQAFGYDKDEVEELITNPANTIAYIEDSSGRIASTVMAEHGTVDVHGLPPINMVEITEAFTAPIHRGKGLYRLISKHLSDWIITERVNTPVHVLYGESNLAMQGVINACAENGRRFSHHDRQQFGIDRDDFGILPQNVTVKDGVETRAYNDFALTYFALEG